MEKNKIGLREIQMLSLIFFKKIQTFLQNNEIQFFCIAGTALGAVRNHGFIPWDDDIDIGMDRHNYQLFLSKSSELDNHFFRIEHYSNTKNVNHGHIRICFLNTSMPDPALNRRLSDELYMDVFPLDDVPANKRDQQKQGKELQRLRTITYLKTRKRAGKSIKSFSLSLAQLFLFPLSLRWLAKRRDYVASKKYAKHSNNHFLCSMMSQYSYSKQCIPQDVYGRGVVVPFEGSSLPIPEKYVDYLTHLYGSDFMIPKKRNNNNTPEIAYVDDEILKLIKSI